MGRLLDLVKSSYSEKRRIVAPLVGFPGVKIAQSSIKLAQQNHEEHFKVVSSLVDKFKPDIQFVLMDLSVEANALGLNTLFPPDDSATVMKKHGKFGTDELALLEKIKFDSDSRLLSYVKTVELMKRRFPAGVKVGAYVTGPYTLAGLIIGAEEAGLMAARHPEKLEEICVFTNDCIMRYAELLLSAGADAVCVLEPSGVMLGPSHFEKFSVANVKDIVKLCHTADSDCIYHVCGNSTHLIEKMVESGVDGLSLDSKDGGIYLSEIAKNIQKNIVLIGNISPSRTIVYGSPKEVKEEVKALLESMDSFPNYVLSTGCDLPLETPVDNISAFMETGRNYTISV
ncbi:uroporphyrinogen decarboxylase family protein [candidate division WOR-3 bacterium]|nr:uroporphyrinogen decarboxylase family protein [candidate division WOR-3 bacterium]